MRDITSDSFGLLIAYLIPGFIILWGLSQFSPDVQGWMGTSENDGHTIGGFLYGTVAAVATGLTASTVRWLLIDPLHHWTGVKVPAWDLHELHARTTAFEILIEIHYRYYQFYANTFVALPFAAIARWTDDGFRWLELAGLIVLMALFFAGSRDTLAKYYGRVDAMLKRAPP